jgi:hypothetical protein
MYVFNIFIGSYSCHFYVYTIEDISTNVVLCGVMNVWAP